MHRLCVMTYFYIVDNGNAWVNNKTEHKKMVYMNYVAYFSYIYYFYKIMLMMAMVCCSHPKTHKIRKHYGKDCMGSNET